MTFNTVKRVILLLASVGFIKILFQLFGMEIQDSAINNFSNGIAAILDLAGTVLSVYQHNHLPQPIVVTAVNHDTVLQTPVPVIPNGPINVMSAPGAGFTVSPVDKSVESVENSNTGQLLAP